MQSLPACPLLDGALDFFCLIHFLVHCLIPGSSGHSTHPVALSFPISILSFTADPTALKIGHMKIQSQTLKKCAHVNAVKQPKTQPDAPFRMFPFQLLLVFI